MKMKTRALIAGALATTLLCLGATAGTTLNGVRVGAKDPAQLAKFYQSVFGMFEVQRIQTPQMLEIMLDFGANADAAKANTGADVVIMQQPADNTGDTLPHIVFNVTDMDALVKAIKAAGGKLEREPFEFGKTGIRIGMAIDPAGNHFEMIQAPKR